MPNLSDAAWDGPRAGLDGRLVTPADAGFDEARRVWNADVDRTPAAVVRCAGTGDVVAGLRFAGEHGLEVSVRGGGHHVSGLAVARDGLVLDLAALRGVSLDVEARRVTAGGGATAADLDAATLPHGLALPTGMVGGAGVGGLALSGGFGWLTARMGLTSDNLVAADVVLADGRMLRASAEEEPELFWALRGGGAPVGVVTGWEFGLRPLDGQVQVGLCFWELSRRTDVLRVVRDLVPALPPGYGALLVAGIDAAPVSFVPDQYHRTPGLVLVVVGFDTPAGHTAALRPLRTGPPTLFEFSTPLPFPAMQHLLDGHAPWGVHAYDRSLYLDELTDESVEAITKRLPGSRSPRSGVALLPLRGGYAATPEDATAFPGPRDAGWLVDVTAVASDADRLAADRQWARELWDDLRPHAAGPGEYLGMTSERGPEGVRAAYGPVKHARLAEVVRRYDPDGRFRHPAAAT